MRGVGCAVGAQKEPITARGDRVHQSLAVHFALQHWQAVVMRPHTAHEERIAVVKQMVGGNGGCGKAPCLRHVLRSFAGGDVLENNFQLRKTASQRDEVLVDEHRFTVEEVDIGVCHLPMHQQRHA